MANLLQHVELARAVEGRRVGWELAFSQDSSSASILHGGHWSRCPQLCLHSSWRTLVQTSVDKAPWLSPVSRVHNSYSASGPLSTEMEGLGCRPSLSSQSLKDNLPLGTLSLAPAPNHYSYILAEHLSISLRVFVPRYRLASKNHAGH